ncbi:MAG: BolA family transcriptional regulator [Rhodocyclaceae bacterium]|jgi:BolA protein|nr:BolA family transcriptional regulator [Rhodocyclaceae bacterium]MCE2723686.1 BolA family transcriptional regulator [Betaproteobacteria bacterium]MCA3019021.1 BolA family transcriptional regulator [Rhodocyclaceae bacterium]MCA3022150.1 BolA family transcriptional regulator [Rhodocyclaceae bacterium]MCA3024356.1 BolA family transcriptional regulator [Rhodocyclaceae bacterium]
MVTTREDIIARLSILQPSQLMVEDDSASHAGHRGAIDHAAKTGAQDSTHFAIQIVSSQFVGKTPVARHRIIYSLLDDLMKTRIHALKIDARAA